MGESVSGSYVRPAPDVFPEGDERHAVADAPSAETRTTDGRTPPSDSETPLGTTEEIDGRDGAFILATSPRRVRLASALLPTSLSAARRDPALATDNPAQAGASPVRISPTLI